MTEKSKIAEVLDERSLLLPELIDRALAANARVKFAFTWLQAARAQAEAPGTTPPDLGAERRAAGVGDASLDSALGASHRNGESYVIPGAKKLLGAVVEDLDAMLAPVAAAGQAAIFEPRRTRLGHLPDLAGDRVPLDFISAATRARRDAGDSLHLLVMDLHKAINGLQAGLAEETLDGARVYRLAAEDRPLIQAFMRGLNRTAPLKFDHPGLGTTATRTGSRLVIQNDIGTTDSHVLIVHVEGLRLSVTYTDVHSRRLRFFQERLHDFAMNWTETRARHVAGLEEDEFYHATGSFDAPNQTSLAACLAQIGASLVFLIDWNRARKRLRAILPKAVATDLLRWAAEEEVGHRGFLVAGGEKLVFQALDTVRKGVAPFGMPLVELIGQEQAIEFMRVVLRATSEGLRAKRSEAAIFEEIRADLLVRLEGTSDRLLDLVLDHAALTLDIGELVRETLMRASAGEGQSLREQRAKRAKRWESDADRILVRVRGLIDPRGVPPAWRGVLESADDAADALEEALFHLALLPDARGTTEFDAPGELDPLERLAALVAGGVQSYVRVLAAARRVHRGSSHEEVRDFLAALESVREMEHATDEVEREVVAGLMRGQSDAKRLFLLAAVAEQLEQAADGLLHASLMAGDHVLGERLSG
ncbi:MAG TPA: hypothetical protein VHA10_11840 [Hypericibacter adhaerens]|uniref:Phosphate transport regulator n=1 Tax=Hypericibacter adhaerens TaxID=2602016 RepID=A0A5J6MUI1_9PROT|nr:hypothetical protein [Hypericibacter adhaerens]QEX21312.1 hypothetical protein FRZ61_12370 [Hypericibacter adhaerens]HWA43896.1 hypothetical protein [Hypericibacter adhaerens]